MKTKIIKIIVGSVSIIILAIIVVIVKRRVENGKVLQNSIKQDTTKKQSQTLPYNSIKDSQPIVAPSNPSKRKIYNDTSVVLFFKKISGVYNYKIIDRGFSLTKPGFYDSVFRIIEIHNKGGSLVQKIHPVLEYRPEYMHEKIPVSKLARSYINGFNTKSQVGDDYYGEIVVADLNFDGLEDFATPIGHGTDNGSHYAFYIQDKNKQFEYNKYLTENVIWFPDKINDSLKTFTSTVTSGVYGLNHRTFQYYPKSKKWRIIKDYVIDVRTGKVEK